MLLFVVTMDATVLYVAVKSHWYSAARVANVGSAFPGTIFARILVHDSAFASLDIATFITANQLA